jgi:N-acetylglucosamine-6-phosphate deacetylase
MKSTLFDIQVNGFAGVDFQQPGLTATDVARAVEGLASHETQRFFLTLITDSIPSLCSKLENFESIRAENPVLSSAICGYHKGFKR